MARFFGEAEEVLAVGGVGEGEGDEDAAVFFEFAGAASALCAARLGEGRLGERRGERGRHGEGEW